MANPSEKQLIFTELRLVDIGCENVKGWLFFSLIVYWVRQSKFEILLELDDILFDLEVDFLAASSRSSAVIAVFAPEIP